MEKTSQTTTTENAVESTATPEEKKSLGQKIIDAVTGKKKEETATSTDEPTAEDKKDDETKADDAGTNPDDMAAAIEKAKQDAVNEYIEAEKEKARKAALSPEELKAEEDAAKDKEIEKLNHEILVRDCKDNAVKELDKAGYPVDLADILNYSTKETADDSLKTVMSTFASCLERGVKERLKGKTPSGLNTNNDVNSYEDRQAKMRAAMGIKK